MNNDRKYLCLTIHVVMIVALTFGAATPVSAQDTITYHETEDDILKVLSVAPMQKKGLDDKGVERIVSDYEELIGLLPNGEPARARILFDTNSSDIHDARSRKILGEYAKALDTLHDIVLVVAGHADSRGSDANNLKLSIKRAQAIVDFLVSMHQVDARRLIVSGYGEAYPVASNRTADGQRQNRRVEFIRVK